MSEEQMVREVLNSFGHEYLLQRKDVPLELKYAAI